MIHSHLKLKLLSFFKTRIYFIKVWRFHEVTIFGLASNNRCNTAILARNGISG